MSHTLTVALISDVFFTSDGAERLQARLREARARGAELALLPEIPLNPWSPATNVARDDDAEDAGGPRQRVLSEAARDAGIAVVGGVILRQAPTGIRHNTAVVYDDRGGLVASYRKVHLPEEEGFWEPAHYAAGSEPPSVIDRFCLRIGLQICSDINRPQGCHLLGAMGAEAILAPRATERGTWDRWRTVLVANAMTSCAYVLSVNRPAPEHGVPLGGPSIAVHPHGDVLVETTDPVAVVTLTREAVLEAKTRYPGYLPVEAEMYADAWTRIAAARTIS
jgi:N-carbamoylputrescine amidase